MICINCQNGRHEMPGFDSTVCECGCHDSLGPMEQAYLKQASANQPRENLSLRYNRQRDQVDRLQIACFFLAIGAGFGWPVGWAMLTIAVILWVVLWWPGRDQ